MKCIEIKGQGVFRTSNECAAEMVDSHAALYASKSAWRAAGGLRMGPQKSKGKVSIHPPHGWVNTANRKPGWAK